MIFQKFMTVLLINIAGNCVLLYTLPNLIVEGLIKQGVSILPQIYRLGGERILIREVGRFFSKSCNYGVVSILEEGQKSVIF